MSLLISDAYAQAAPAAAPSSTLSLLMLPLMLVEC